MSEEGAPVWEVWAVRVATGNRPARDNYLHPGDRTGEEAIDFIVFVAARGDDVVGIDTGFRREAGQRRGHVIQPYALPAWIRRR